MRALDRTQPMNLYRAYTVGHDGHFFGFRAYTCINDGDAVEWAKQLVDGHDVELWSGVRFVARLECKSNQHSSDPGTRPS